MKKTLILLLLLVSGVAYAGYYFVPQKMPTFIKPERRACSRIAQLCGASAEAECMDHFTQIRDVVGAEAIRKPIACAMEASTCAESIGCAAGAGVNMMFKGYEQVLKGLNKALGD